jgi:hypothetical protein
MVRLTLVWCVGVSGQRERRGLALDRALADVVVVIHLTFVSFVAAGGILVLRWKRCAYVHIPAVLWAVLVEIMGWVCPLTPLENWFRARAGGEGYTSDFIEHYLLPVLYPAQLTRTFQITLGVLLFALNIAIYSWVIHRLIRQKA